MKKLQYTTDKFINGNWIFKPIKDHSKFYIYYTNSKESTYNTINYSDISDEYGQYLLSVDK